jgi:hypothetical protein
VIQLGTTRRRWRNAVFIIIRIRTVIWMTCFDQSNQNLFSPLPEIKYQIGPRQGDKEKKDQNFTYYWGEAEKALKEHCDDQVILVQAKHHQHNEALSCQTPFCPWHSQIDAKWA